MGTDPGALGGYRAQHGRGYETALSYFGHGNYQWGQIEWGAGGGGNAGRAQRRTVESSGRRRACFVWEIPIESPGREHKAAPEWLHYRRRPGASCPRPAAWGPSRRSTGSGQPWAAPSSSADHHRHHLLEKTYTVIAVVEHVPIGVGAS